MALSRAFLRALGIEEDKISEIVKANSESLAGVTEERDKYRAEAEKLTALQKQLDETQKQLQEAQDTIKAAEKDDYKGKYESEKAAHEKLQADIVAKESAAKKEAALREAAKAAKYSDGAITAILDSKADYAGRIEFDKDGKAKNIEAILSEIQQNRPELTPTVTEQHHNPATPPANVGAAKKPMTWEEIDKIKDTAERQQAMLDNMDALGLKFSA
jgi:DNA repair exonuclease SbcCD ATPase subunit